MSESPVCAWARWPLLWAGCLLLAACAGSQQDIGRYRIVTAGDGLFGLRCQPRTEFYLLQDGPGTPAPLYLGTCSSPQFVTDSMGLPGDPSCFAVSADGSALVYFHRPNWCGAGALARAKAGGVYRHSEQGDILLHAEREVGQLWTRRPTPAHAIRVSAGKTLHPGPPGCPAQLLIFADADKGSVLEAGTPCPNAQDPSP